MLVISKYLIAKISFVVLSVSTVLLYILARNGTMTAVFGPMLAYVVYLLNFALLITSILFYIWQRAHKDTPQKDRLEALETYARLENDGLLISGAATIIEIEADSFWRLKEYGETITIPINTMNPLRLPPVGTRATFAPIGNKDNRAIGVITEITNGRMTVAPAPTSKPSKPKLTAKTMTSN